MSSRARARLFNTNNPASGGYTDVPGPAGATSFTITWPTPILSDSGSALGYTPVVRIDYGTTEGVYPYCKYIVDGSLGTGTVSGIASNTYYVRLVYVVPVTNEESYEGQPVQRVT